MVERGQIGPAAPAPEKFIDPTYREEAKKTLD
jgi:hypothetical protein